MKKWGYICGLFVALLLPLFVSSSASALSSVSSGWWSCRNRTITNANNICSTPGPLDTSTLTGSSATVWNDSSAIISIYRLGGYNYWLPQTLSNEGTFSIKLTVQAVSGSGGSTVNGTFCPQYITVALLSGYTTPAFNNDYTTSFTCSVQGAANTPSSIYTINGNWRASSPSSTAGVFVQLSSYAPPWSVVSSPTSFITIVNSSNTSLSGVNISMVSLFINDGSQNVVDAVNQGNRDDDRREQEVKDGANQNTSDANSANQNQDPGAPTPNSIIDAIKGGGSCTITFPPLDVSTTSPGGLLNFGPLNLCQFQAPPYVSTIVTAAGVLVLFMLIWGLVKRVQAMISDTQKGAS